MPIWEIDQESAHFQLLINNLQLDCNLKQKQIAKKYISHNYRILG